jgi:hypothetical protein
LITPWSHAVASRDAREVDAFRERHGNLLELVRRQRAPLLAELPAPRDWKRAVRQAHDAEVLDRIRAARDRLVGNGFLAPAEIVLVASGAPGAGWEALPDRAPRVVLFLDRLEGAEAILGALAAAMAVLTRWADPRHRTPVARLAAAGSWDRWHAAREAPLAEWIYAAGIGVHAALEESGATEERALELDATQVRRLRAGERELQARLDADLDQAGIGLVMRWLEDEASPAMRRCRDGYVVPRGSGRYLGWRMLTERVARVGLLEAAVMAAN